MYIAFTLLISFIGGFVYVVSHNAKVEQLAIATFFSGMLAFLLQASHFAVLAR